MAMKDEYQAALDSQNACNSSGLIRSLARATEAIWEEARQAGKGTDYVNCHPIIVLYLEQLAHLSGTMLSHPRYSEAYAACELGAKQD